MNFFFFPLTFGLIMWGKLKNNWCGVGLGCHFHAFHSPPTPPDVLLLAMPSFSFTPAILLPIRENIPEIWVLQELFSFFKKNLFLNANHRMSFFISFQDCWRGSVRVPWVVRVGLGCDEDAFLFWEGLRTRQQAHTEALCHLLLTPEEMETGAALGAQWRFFCWSYCTTRLALHTAHH